MKTSLRFRNFEGFEHLRRFVENEALHNLGPFESRHGLDVRIILNETRARSESHKPIFECELLVRGLSDGSQIFARKRSPNFYQAVQSTMRAIEKTLRRKSKARVARRRRPPMIRDSKLHAVA